MLTKEETWLDKPERVSLDQKKHAIVVSTSDGEESLYHLPPWVCSMEVARELLLACRLAYFAGLSYAIRKSQDELRDVLDSAISNTNLHLRAIDKSTEELSDCAWIEPTQGPE